MPAKENSRRKHAPAEPTAADIFDKPPGPHAPLPPAWTDNSIARSLADERGAETIAGELNAMNGRPPAPKKPPRTKKEITDEVVESALARIEQARIIQIKEYPELRWAVKGIIPEGCTFIAGPPKLGKSIFCLNIAVAVAEGGKALSYFDVEQGAVLYLALEDSERRIQKRLKKLVSTELSGNLEVVTKWPRLNVGGLDAIEKWARTRTDARLLIVDTFKMLRPLRAGAQNNVNTYDIDYEDVSQLTEFTTEKRICLVIVTHTRKAFADDPLATVSGSFGLTGAADGVLVLSRARNNRSATLTVIGRDVEEQELALEFTPDNFLWAVLGESKSIRQSDERKEILEILRDAEKPMTPGEIAVLVGRNSNMTRVRLWRMRRDGDVAIFGKGYHLPGYVSQPQHSQDSAHAVQEEIPF
jgi:archaellum biogenesis ATPase FlaH